MTGMRLCMLPALCMLAGTGCQSTLLRPYDGTVGYQLNATGPGTLRVIYAEEDRVSWAGLRDRVLRVCAERLARPASAIQLTELGRQTQDRDVDVDLAIPITPVPAANLQAGAPGPSPAPAPITLHQTETRTVTVKQLTATCTTR